MSCKTSLYSKINLLPNKKHKIMVIFTMLHISVLPASGPLSKPVELLDPAAMSKRGWITSILNTPFFCHRFSTLTILLWRRKRNIIKWAFDSNHLNHKMRVLNKELFKKKKKGHLALKIFSPDLLWDTSINSQMFQQCFWWTWVQTHLFQHQTDAVTVSRWNPPRRALELCTQVCTVHKIAFSKWIQPTIIQFKFSWIQMGTYLLYEFFNNLDNMLV